MLITSWSLIQNFWTFSALFKVWTVP